jgi:lipopolysaccharide export system protein LptC
MSNIVFVVSSLLLGWVALFPARRSFDPVMLHALAIPLGLLTWIAPALAFSALGRPWVLAGMLPLALVAAVAMAAAFGAAARGRAGDAPRLWTYPLAAAVAAAVAWWQVFAGFSLVGFDSYGHWEASGMWLSEVGRIEPWLMSGRALLTWALLLAALLSGWLVLRHRTQAPATFAAGGRSDYELHDFELVALDKTGKESFTLRAPLLQQTPGARTMELKTPLFLLPDIAGHYWQVRSATGWVSENRDELRLRGHVVTVNPPEDPRRITMNTEQLNVYPNTRRATSAAVVTVTEPGLTMRGRGLDADLAAKRLTLLSQATARYVSSH